MKPSPTVQDREHIAAFDYLRIFAACCIVLLHVSAQNWDSVSVDSSAWRIFNIANSAGRWAVPVFLMISGALFLDNDRPLDIKKLWHVRILRMGTAFLFWSAVYALEDLLLGASPADALGSFLEGKYHMWYLLTLAGLYILTPLVRTITASRSLTRYYLGTALLFVILLPRGLHLLTCLEIPFLSRYLPEMEDFLAQFHFGFGQIYLFYYILGYSLMKYGLPGFSDRAYPLLGIGGYLCTVGLTEWYSGKTGTGVTAFYSLNSLNVLVMSTAGFLFARNILSRMQLPERAEKSVRMLSKSTFGVYLIHPLVLDILEEFFALHTLTFPPVFAVPAVTIVTLAVSFALSALLHRIPVLKKYVV